MKLKSLALAAALICSFASYAQTADEILAKYFENTGGIEKWKALNGLKMSAKANDGGMEIPLEIIRLKDGKGMVVITFQGKEIKQGVFDGNTLWATNFMTSKAEKSDAEATENYKKESGDFPSPLLDYKSRGYKVELLGKETVEGSETFKLKLTKSPIKVDGKDEENVVFYYFDTENFVPIMEETEMKTGPAKGKVGQSKMSDYQEVDGLLIPFSLSEGVKGEQSQVLTITKVELNPKVDVKAFAFPEGQ